MKHSEMLEVALQWADNHEDEIAKIYSDVMSDYTTAIVIKEWGIKA